MPRGLAFRSALRIDRFEFVGVEPLAKAGADVVAAALSAEGGILMLLGDVGLVWSQRFRRGGRPRPAVASVRGAGRGAHGEKVGGLGRSAVVIVDARFRRVALELEAV